MMVDTALKRRIEDRFGRQRGAAGAAGGDYDLNPHAAPDGPRRGLRRAAVLVPIVERADALTVLLTVRTPHLDMHAGQIAFPGGGCEDRDPTPEATALRETEEETGIRPDEVRLIGRMAPYETRTGFHVTPVVGFVAPDYTAAPDPFEVAEVFEAPLGFILDPANHKRHTMERDGVTYRFHAIPWRDYYIWGATAGMLLNFYRELGD